MAKEVPQPASAGKDARSKRTQTGFHRGDRVIVQYVAYVTHAQVASRPGYVRVARPGSNYYELIPAHLVRRAP